MKVGILFGAVSPKLFFSNGTKSILLFAQDVVKHKDVILDLILRPLSVQARGTTLAMKPGVAVTRSVKYRNQWIHKKIALCGLRWFKLNVSKCQKDVKCQIVKHLDYGGGWQKKQIDTMRFTHIDINFDVRYEGHQNCPKILSMDILRVFSDHHMWRQIDINVWTSLCQFIVFVNLLHSLGVRFFDIWHLFDNLTSFDILTHYLACTPLSMCLKSLYPIAHYAPLPMCPIPLYTIAPCAPLPMCPIPLYPIAHVPHTPVPHCPCAPYPCTP